MTRSRDTTLALAQAVTRYRGSDRTYDVEL